MKNHILSIAFLFVSTISMAVEGMWIPSLIKMFHSDMKTYGLELSPEQIYDTNGSSLKDAIVQFNGGCTAEIVSDQGLLLTNHHCGFDAIQRHSSVENNYLKDGFWAMNLSEEIPCPWMRVTFVRELTDVTENVMEGITDKMSTEDMEKTIQNNIRLLVGRMKHGPSVKVSVKPFNKGNQYFMLITEDYNDIRLVGTPPSAIGKYGGDTDNWVWPRHTGDFAVFRIYADENNNSSKFETANKPYKPAYFLPISMVDKEEGDFTMVYGFPGTTDQHYCKEKLDFIMNQERPARIKMRQSSLDLIKPAMNSDAKIGIQYASKQARIANAWKKWIGQLGGLQQLDALSVKEDWENEYKDMANSDREFTNRFGTVLDDLSNLQNENQRYEFANSIFFEYYIYGPEFLRYAREFGVLTKQYETLVEKGTLDETLEKLKGHVASFYKNYNKDLDQAIYNALTPLYLDYTEADLQPSSLAENWEKIGNDIFKNSMLMDLESVNSMLDNFNKKCLKKLQKDPALQLAEQVVSAYLTKIRPSFISFTEKEEVLMQTYVEGILTMFPDKKTWADANSTLRIAYGRMEGSAPHDGMKYTHFTTIDGVMQKYDPENPDFVLTDRFIELYNKKDFGQYTQDGELWVCFTASNHTTGGNSGSPVIDGKGRLMGINFDRSWESTMSDFMFDESRCRNIAVDIRYVLWVIDKYGGATHLIDEMELAR